MVCDQVVLQDKPTLGMIINLEDDFSSRRAAQAERIQRALLGSSSLKEDVSKTHEGVRMRRGGGRKGPESSRGNVTEGTLEGENGQMRRRYTTHRYQSEMAVDGKR